MHVVKLRPINGDVTYSRLAVVAMATAPYFDSGQQAAKLVASEFRPHDMPEADIPHAKAVARAINRIVLVLRRRGWIASDFNSSELVFTHPSHDYVLTLIDNPRAQVGWLEYAQWAEANHALSPAVPRIHRIVRFESGPFFTCAVKRERLANITTDRDAREIARNVAYVLGGRYKNGIRVRWCKYKPPTAEELISSARKHAATFYAIKAAIDGIPRHLVGEQLELLNLYPLGFMVRPESREPVLVHPIANVLNDPWAFLGK